MTNPHRYPMSETPKVNRIIRLFDTGDAEGNLYMTRFSKEDNIEIKRRLPGGCWFPWHNMNADS